jgi:hypothetical protein
MHEHINIFYEIIITLSNSKTNIQHNVITDYAN